MYSPDNATIQAKLKGYTDAMNSFNLTPTVYWNGESTDTYHAGYSLIIELLKKDSLPSAIWCASDLMAYGVLEALKENESLLSKKVSVLGHDDLFFSSLPSNSLSTIALPKVELAQSAYIHAKKLMEDKTLSCKILVNNHLIKRNSTKEY